LAPDLPLTSEFVAIPSTNPDTVSQFGILRERQSVTPAIAAMNVTKIHGDSFSTSDFVDDQKLVEHEKMSCLAPAQYRNRMGEFSHSSEDKSMRRRVKDGWQA
jgi:hypothetical protein